jgi:hypothetical protein
METKMMIIKRDEYFEQIIDIDKYSEFPSVSINPFNIDLGEVIKEKEVIGGCEMLAVKDYFNTDTGEITKGSKKALISYKKKEVDDEQFLKIYLDRFKELYGLSMSAIKVFGYFMMQMQLPANKNRSIIYFNLKDCMMFCKYKQHNMVYDGLVELIRNRFIAKCSSPENHYWVDSRTVANGNRKIIIVNEYNLKDKQLEIGE